MELFGTVLTLVLYLNVTFPTIIPYYTQYLSTSVDWKQYILNLNNLSKFLSLKKIFNQKQCKFIISEDSSQEIGRASCRERV